MRLDDRNLGLQVAKDDRVAREEEAVRFRLRIAQEEYEEEGAGCLME